MTQITYADLKQKWADQRDQYMQWRHKLVQSAFNLRVEVATQLGISEGWHWVEQSGATRFYLSFSDFYSEDEVIEVKPTEKLINDNGELIFGMSLAFEKMANSFPKEIVQIPICIRFNKGLLEYSFFSIALNASENRWTTDQDKFASELIQCWSSHLSHDPHEGFDNKPRIGFITD